VILDDGLILGVEWFWVAQRFSAAIEAIILGAALASEAGRAVPEPSSARIKIINRWDEPPRRHIVHRMPPPYSASKWTSQHSRTRLENHEPQK
jgi:hypothetical protein